MGKKCYELEKTLLGPANFLSQCRFALKSNDRKNFVYRVKGSRLNPKNVIEYERWSNNSWVIWGGISAQSRTRPKTH